MKANQEDTPLQGDTTSIKKCLALSAFYKITVFDASTVVVRLGKSYNVEIDGSKVYADAQRAYVDGEELIVKYTDHDSNHRKTAVCISVPSLEKLKVIGCGKLTMLGSECRSPSLDIDLQRVNVVILSPCLVADNVSLSLKDVMFAQFRVNSKRLNLSAHSVDHAKVWGISQYLSVDSDNPNLIDISGLKLGKSI